MCDDRRGTCTRVSLLSCRASVTQQGMCKGQDTKCRVLHRCSFCAANRKTRRSSISVPSSGQDWDQRRRLNATWSIICALFQHCLAGWRASSWQHLIAFRSRYVTSSLRAMVGSMFWGRCRDVACAGRVCSVLASYTCAKDEVGNWLCLWILRPWPSPTDHS